MILGPTLIYKCPDCTNIFSRTTFVSFNNFGNRIYSNGYSTNNPPLIDLYKCRLCGKLLWKEQLQLSNEYERDDSSWIFDNLKVEDKKHIPDEWRQAQSIDSYNLTLSDLKTVLEGQFILNLKQEVSIRKYIWVVFNDKVSFNFMFNSFDLDENFYSENTEKLTEILDPNIIENKFILAEITRNKGEFDTCLSLISTIESSSYEKTKDRFIEESNKKNSDLFII